jgi:hypothetical protein
MILAKGADMGVLRGDVDADDVTMMLLGIFYSTMAGGAFDRIDRFLDLLVDSLRPVATTDPPVSDPPASSA